MLLILGDAASHTAALVEALDTASHTAPSAPPIALDEIAAAKEVAVIEPARIFRERGDTSPRSPVRRFCKSSKR